MDEFKIPTIDNHIDTYDSCLDDEYGCRAGLICATVNGSSSKQICVKEE